jgi:hypothetical protein
MGTRETTDSTEGTPGDAGDQAAPTAAPLAGTVVRYRDGPDRLTVYPADASDIDRMSTWLTADADACPDLAEMR